MHLLFSLIARLVARLYIQRLARFGVNLAIILAYIGAIINITIAFYGILDAALVGISVFMPGRYVDLVSAFIPSNLQACFSVVISARILRMSLLWTLRLRSIAVEMAMRT